MEVFEKLSLYFSYPAVWYALIVAVAVSACAALFGVTLVLKRFSFIGDGLSHVAFGAMAVSAVVGLTDNMFITMPVTIICAVIILKAGTNAKIKGDAAVAMIAVGALAVGYLLLNIFHPSANIASDVCSALFGSTAILTLDIVDVVVCLAICLVAVTVFVLLYNRLFAVTFDENFATAIGVKSKTYNLLISVVIAVVVVLAMKFVGSLLVSAIIVFPALSAMRVFKSFKSVTICAVVISACAAIAGIVIALIASTPVGPTVVVVDIFVFLDFLVWGRDG